MHALDVGLVVNAASGVLMIALGAFVATVRGSRRANRAFALFAVPFGCAFILENLWGFSGGHGGAFGWIPSGALLVAAAFGLAGIASAATRAAGGARRGHVAIAVGAGLGVFLVEATLLVPLYAAHVRESPVILAGWAGSAAFHAIAWAILVHIALRYREVRRGDARAAAGLRLMSAALVLYPAFYRARDTVAALDVLGWPPMGAAVGFTIILAQAGGLAAIWLRNAARSEHPARERHLAWLCLGAALLGLPSLGFGGTGNHPGYGLARTLGVVILAYAIVRHQILGIDVKVRWGVSRGTVAASFVAVFFVASEAAQQFLGDTIGSKYAGIAAAGALVFAIAPLQRVAERLAERAVPVIAVAEEGSHPHARAYRLAVLAAVNDGRLTQDEEAHLADLAEELGIGAGEALRLRRSVEQEVAAQ